MEREPMEKFLCVRLLDPTQPISEQFRALFSLRNLKGPGPRDALISATRDPSNLLAREAAFALGQMQDVEAIPALVQFSIIFLCIPLLAMRRQKHLVQLV